MNRLKRFKSLFFFLGGWLTGGIIAVVHAYATYISPSPSEIEVAKELMHTIQQSQDDVRLTGVAVAMSDLAKQSPPR